MSNAIVFVLIVGVFSIARASQVVLSIYYPEQQLVEGSSNIFSVIYSTDRLHAQQGTVVISSTDKVDSNHWQKTLQLPESTAYISLNVEGWSEAGASKFSIRTCATGRTCRHATSYTASISKEGSQTITIFPSFDNELLLTSKETQSSQLMHASSKELNLLATPLMAPTMAPVNATTVPCFLLKEKREDAIVWAIFGWLLFGLSFLINFYTWYTWYSDNRENERLLKDARKKNAEAGQIHEDDPSLEMGNLYNDDFKTKE